MRHMGGKKNTSETFFSKNVFCVCVFLGLEFFFFHFFHFLCYIHQMRSFCLDFSQGKFKEIFFLRTASDKVGSKTALQEYSALIKTDLVSFTTKQIPDLSEITALMSQYHLYVHTGHLHPLFFFFFFSVLSPQHCLKNLLLWIHCANKA